MVISTTITSQCEIPMEQDRKLSPLAFRWKNCHRTGPQPAIP
jgi:hypothetical protein